MMSFLNLVLCSSVYVHAWKHVGVRFSYCVHRSLHMYLMLEWRFTLQWLRDITAIYWATRDRAHWGFIGRPNKNAQISCSYNIKQNHDITLNQKIELRWSEDHRASENTLHSFQSWSGTLYWPSQINIKTSYCNKACCLAELHSMWL